MTKVHLTADGRIHIPVGETKSIVVVCPVHDQEIVVWVRATGKGIALVGFPCGVGYCKWKGVQGLRYYLRGDDSVEVEHL